MARLVLIAILAVTVIHCYGAMQVQMPDAAELQDPDDDLAAQVRDLQRNVSEIWTYMHELRTAVSQHLTHLRQHQVELETSVHKMEHHYDSAGGDSHTHGDPHGDSHSHHHSGEKHSHSGEQHSHGGDHDSDHHSHSSDHSHGGDHGGDHHSHGSDHGGDHHSHGSDHGADHHSYSGGHSHGGDSSDHHSHSGEHHSHSGEHHSHSGEHHSHSGEQGGHHSDSHSHSHTSHDHSKEDSSHSHSHNTSHDSHSHGSDNHQDHDHKDSHETEDIQQVASDTGLVLEPVVTVTPGSVDHDRHHHHHSHGQAGGSSGHSHSQAGESSGRSNTMDLMNEHSFHHHHGHHHHHDSSSRSRNRTVDLPKYSDYDLYDFAICNVQPNRAIPEEQQQNVGGKATLWQKKSGGPLNIHLRLQGFKIGDHHGHHGAHQAVQQEEGIETPFDIETPQAGHRHGFHVHTNGDLSNGCQSTGPHYNPKNVNHGGPTALIRHVGDLGNIECDSNGVTNILFSDDIASLRGPYSIVGKSLVIHADQDDLGLGGNPESLKTGNAGVRIACCIIQGTEKLPIRYYKAMKTATQYQNS